MSSAISRTTGLLVASLAIVGRKDASFDPQLDFRLFFFRPSSLALHDEFPWLALQLRLDHPFTTLTLPLTLASSAELRLRGLAGTDHGRINLGSGLFSVVGRCYHSKPDSYLHMSRQRLKVGPRIEIH